MRCESRYSWLLTCILSSALSTVTLILILLFTGGCSWIQCSPLNTFTNICSKTSMIATIPLSWRLIYTSCSIQKWATWYQSSLKEKKRRRITMHLHNAWLKCHSKVRILPSSVLFHSSSFQWQSLKKCMTFNLRLEIWFWNWKKKLN